MSLVINPRFKSFDFPREHLPTVVADTLDENKPLKIVEVGVETGAYLDIYYPQLESITEKFYLVDMWQYEGNEDFVDKYSGGNYNNELEKGYDRVKRLYGDNPKVQMCKGSSEDWAEKFEDEFFDYLYLDADHSKKSVLADLKSWYPKVKNGGIIAGHDVYCDQNNAFREHFDVEGALAEFFSEEQQENIHLTNEYAYRTWIYLKPEL